MSPLSHRQHIFLRLIVVPIAALLAAHIVFRQVFPGQAGYYFPWAYFLTVATVMLSCWEVNLFIFRWLDGRLPFSQQPVRRLLAQILMGGCATLLTFSVVFPLSQWAYSGQWPPTTTVVKGIAVCVTLASLLNGAYSGLYLIQAFYTERQKREHEVLSTPVILPSTERATSTASLISISVLNGQLRLPIDQVAYFYSTGGLVLLVKSDGQQITTRFSSLPSLLDTIDNQYFFQLSRQFVVSAGAVRAVQDDVNRKLIVTLVPALHKQDAGQDVIVSRYRSLELKKWLQAAPVN
ncbi:LytTR family DNA-binding domain-containing protein [Spirosoma pollinicola]|uniref:LytTR family transcriptional regulator n=1 Tax=Spirosoma pollinicola TaxID=2057025 RepID=A0A2K8Z0D1_9BACT|nr:LytTR family DNA-binding domain-containing protein [Spirosoma pollinicola]AUD03315.1 LytTR family transcriptional regulator [Spirosoma pollinicola]